MPTSSAGEEPAAKPNPEAKPDNPLHLVAARRDAAGIKVDRPRSVPLPPEIEAFGRVLDPTPYVTLVAETATARASLAASEKELARVQKLFAAGGNASAQAVETAEAAAARDRAAVASAELRLVAGWGRALAARTDLAAWRELFAQGAALIRIDLLPDSNEQGSGDRPDRHAAPMAVGTTAATSSETAKTQIAVGTTAATAFKMAKVALVGGGDTFNAEVLGPAPLADPQVQGASFLALVRDRSLPSGAALRVVLTGAGDPVPMLTIPRSALVYHQGSAWVFVLEKNDTFERKLVTLGRSLGDDVAIASGIDADDLVAFAGAQQLLSAELQAGEAPDER